MNFDQLCIYESNAPSKRGWMFLVLLLSAAITFACIVGAIIEAVAALCS